MRVSLVASIFNRTRLLRRGLFTLARQTMSKKDYEIIIVQDSRSTEDIHAELVPYIKTLQMQWAIIDNTRFKGGFDIKVHTPALSNNVGFRLAKGEVIVISQPEIMHAKDNLTELYQTALTPRIVFGGIHHSSYRFVDDMSHDPSWMGQTYDQWIERPGAHDRDTHDILNGHYWFVAGFPKYFVELIGGIDEEYLRGVYAEDDNFRDRMELAGCKKTINWNIKGIHQNHDNENHYHAQRQESHWEEWANINRARYAEFKCHPDMVANKEHTWGDLDTVIEHRVYGID